MAQSAPDIGELEATLEDDHLIGLFRAFLRQLDGKSKAAPEIKGRFERLLDFILVQKRLYALPEGDVSAQRQLLLDIRSQFFACSPTQRLSVPSQVALKAMASSLTRLMQSADEAPDLKITRPVFEDAYMKLQDKHDIWKKNYKPSLSLNAILCLLS